MNSLQKIIFPVLLIAALVLFVKKKAFANFKDVAKETQKAAINEIVVPSNLSLSKAELNQHIADLYGYMSGFGTKEKEIFNLLLLDNLG